MLSVVTRVDRSACQNSSPAVAIWRIVSKGELTFVCESRVIRSTRCQYYNVRPDQVPFRVTDRSGRFVLVFKPLRGWRGTRPVPAL
jgi:hypothetical protein